MDRRTGRLSHALFVSLIMLIGILTEGCSGSLDDLAERHLATRPAPPETKNEGAVLLSSPRHWGSDKYATGTNGSGVRQGFTSEGVFLEIGAPGFKKALWIPMAAIAGCSHSRVRGTPEWWRTGLWVEDSLVLIRVTDNHDRIAKWCKERGLTVFDETKEREWLQRKDPNR